MHPEYSAVCGCAWTSNFTRLIPRIFPSPNRAKIEPIPRIERRTKSRCFPMKWNNTAVGICGIERNEMRPLQVAPCRFEKLRSHDESYEPGFSQAVVNAIYNILTNSNIPRCKEDTELPASQLTIDCFRLDASS